VTSAADAIPDDPALLKAMLLAERPESKRLRQSSRIPATPFRTTGPEPVRVTARQLGLEEPKRVERAGEGESESEENTQAERGERASTISTAAMREPCSPQRSPQNRRNLGPQRRSWVLAVPASHLTPCRLGLLHLLCWPFLWISARRWLEFMPNAEICV
jgi:hypothetical protein